MNSPVYTPALASTLPSSKSLLHFIVNQSETIQSQVLILTHYIKICVFAGFYCFLGDLLSWVLLVMIKICLCESKLPEEGFLRFGDERLIAKLYAF